MQTHDYADTKIKSKAFNQAKDQAFIKYDHLITTRPHDVRRVIISDLHLSADEPALVQAFLNLLDDLLVLPKLSQLIILGDWFDMWVGDDAYLALSDDDKSTHWLSPIIKRLRQLKHRHCDILVMHGNRDFLIGQNFCDSFGGELIHEPYPLQCGVETFRLEHGDALCTDDKSYQRFRKIMRNKVVQALLLRKPLSKRLDLAKRIKQQSAVGKSEKSMAIMDVNEDAVIKALNNVDHLLHGHTHRPAVHQYDTSKHSHLKSVLKFGINKVNSKFFANDSSNQPKLFSKVMAKLKNPLVKNTSFKNRYVLGDWRINTNSVHENHGKKTVTAVIGVELFDQTISHIQSSDDQSELQSNTKSRKNPRFELVSFAVNV